MLFCRHNFERKVSVVQLIKPYHCGVDSVVADSDTDSDTDDSDDDDAFNEQNDTSVNEAPGELACESADEQGT